MIRLVLVVLVVAGCHKKDAGSCRTDAAELAQFLSNLDHGAVEIELRDTALVERGGLPALTKTSWPSLVLHGGIRIDGHDVSVDEIGAALAARGKGHDYGLAVDASETWGHVEAAITAARLGGFDHSHFVFARPGKGTPPPRVPIDDQLDALFAHQQLQDFLTLTTETVSRCPALLKTFGRVSPSTGDKSAEILSELTPALIECDCNVDLDALRSILYRLYSLPHPETELVVTIADGAPVVMLPATMSWRDASQHLDGTTPTITLRVSQ